MKLKLPQTPAQPDPVVAVEPVLPQYQKREYSMEWLKIVRRFRDESNFADGFIPAGFKKKTAETLRQLLTHARIFVNDESKFKATDDAEFLAEFESADNIAELISLGNDIEIRRNGLKGIVLHHAPGTVGEEAESIAEAMTFGEPSKNANLRRELIAWIRDAPVGDKFPRSGIALSDDDMKWFQKVLDQNNGILIGSIQPTSILIIKEPN